MSRMSRMSRMSSARNQTGSSKPLVLFHSPRRKIAVRYLTSDGGKVGVAPVWILEGSWRARRKPIRRLEGVVPGVLFEEAAGGRLMGGSSRPMPKIGPCAIARPPRGGNAKGLFCAPHRSHRNACGFREHLNICSAEIAATQRLAQERLRLRHCWT